MAQAKNGDTVNVHYTGKFDDGEVFDSSVDREPLQFTLGNGNMIPGFEKAVLGMNPGESKTTKLPANEAYGEYNKEMVFSIEKSSFNFRGDLEPAVGQYWQIEKDNGQVMNVRVADVSDASVTLDANHPLAGKDLTFDIELVEIL